MSVESALDDELEHWKGVFAANPTHPKAGPKVAELLFDRGRLMEARAAFQAYAEHAPDNLKVWKRIASISETLEDRPAAIVALRRVVALDPGYGRAHGRLAEFLYQEGFPEEALEHRRISKGLLAQREKGPKHVATPPTNEKTAPVIAELERMAKTDLPIVVGPWEGEVGFELLYWIPLLRRLMEDHNIDTGRLRVISRGGVAAWYAGLIEPGQYAELYDAVPPAELSRIAQERHEATGSDKALTVSKLDRQLVERLYPGEVELIHPSVLYRLLGDYWRGTVPFIEYAGRTKFSLLPPPEWAGARDLPETFTAVKFYSRESFPMDADNTRFVESMILRLAEKGPVVVLDTGVEVYTHEDYGCPKHPNVVSLKPLMNAGDNLHIQSAVVARSREVVCTYGGFAYLPLLYGKPVTAYYSCGGHQLVKHSQAAYHLAEQMRADLSICSAASLRDLV